MRAGAARGVQSYSSPSARLHRMPYQIREANTANTIYAQKVPVFFPLLQNVPFGA